MIVGNRRVQPQELREIPGGIEAEFSGAALNVLIDASFGSGDTIELWRGAHLPERLDVIDIRMEGCATTVTLSRAGAMALN